MYKADLKRAVAHYEKQDNYSKHHERDAKKITEYFSKHKKLPPFSPLEIAKIEEFCDCLPWPIMWYIKNIYK